VFPGSGNGIAKGGDGGVFEGGMKIKLTKINKITDIGHLFRGLAALL
jgi:hypothetical protein